MKPAPKFVTRALIATFGTVAIVLVAVFVLITVDVQRRVRAAVVANLDAGQQAAARVEERRQHDLLAMVATLAENPTLKAAVDTWQSERGIDGGMDAELIETVQREADKIAVRIDADVVALADVDGRVIVSAGRDRDAWARGDILKARRNDEAAEFVTRVHAGVFRVIGVPLRFGDAVIGSLEIGRALDAAFARELADFVHGDSVVTLDGKPVATTLPARTTADLNVLRSLDPHTAALVEINGEAYALRRVYEVPPARFFTLAAIDGPARVATAAALWRISGIGAVALILAAVGSYWIAHTMTRPIDQLSASVSAMAVARRFDTPLAATGASREIDALTGTFNELIGSVAAAEAQTQAAYLGAIRALAAALDARDPYTAGHSERVSALSVAMGKALGLDSEEVETLRLGALLHDIGKIGVPDDVLGKPSSLTPSEFEMIRAHPVIGAHILQSIPFLRPHLPIVELHHERPDGRGYPYGLAADAIPLAARIVHVADAYDAMTSARAYRPARQSYEAIAELRRCTGTDFDRDAVQALIVALPSVPISDLTPDSLPYHFTPALTRYAS